MLAAASALALAVACGSGSEDRPDDTVSPGPAATAEGTSAIPQIDPTQPDPASDPATPASTPTPMPTSVPHNPLFDSPTEKVVITDLEGIEASNARRWQLSYNWFTDFNKRTVSLAEISNLLPRDRIKPVDDPQFAVVSDPPSYMRAREPVVAVNINGDARAYPLAILMWQEIANDTVGGVQVTVTFCPLCNTAITFERILEGHELTFGTSGNLRNSDLVMWDRQTESWWQQITGEAIVGQLAGKVLTQIPSPIVAWEDFASQYPEGKVLLREVDALGSEIRPYDDPPYSGYDSVDNLNPFAFDGPLDDRLPPAMRVLTVKNDATTVAYPFTFLRESPVVNDNVGGEDVVAFFDDGTLSAFLDGNARPQNSGSTTLFSRELDGQTLTFSLTESGIVDEETGSTWSILGKATDGPLAGGQLEPVLHQNHFWFAWAVFEPETEVRSSSDAVAGPVSGAL